MALPAQGIIELRDALTELLDGFGKEDVGKAHCTVEIQLPYPLDQDQGVASSPVYPGESYMIDLVIHNR